MKLRSSCVKLSCRTMTLWRPCVRMRMSVPLRPSRRKARGPEDACRDGKFPSRALPRPVFPTPRQRAQAASRIPFDAPARQDALSRQSIRRSPQGRLRNPCCCCAPQFCRPAHAPCSNRSGANRPANFRLRFRAIVLHHRGAARHGGSSPARARLRCRAGVCWLSTMAVQARSGYCQYPLAQAV